MRTIVWRERRGGVEEGEEGWIHGGLQSRRRKNTGSEKSPWVAIFTRVWTRKRENPSSSGHWGESSFFLHEFVFFPSIDSFFPFFSFRKHTGFAQKISSINNKLGEIYVIRFYFLNSILGWKYWKKRCVRVYWLVRCVSRKYTVLAWFSAWFGEREYNGRQRDISRAW